MKTGYVTETEGVVALVGTTAKTVIGVKGGAAFGVDLLGLDISFDGVTAANVGVLVELCYATWATNGPGTNSTSTTIDTAYGRAVASGMTAAKNWTTEPTVLTVLREFLVTPNAGFFPYEFPRDRTWDSAVAEGFAIRCTAPNNVNCRSTLFFERG